MLKVGAWFCARTPNRWSYFSVGARSVQTKALRMLQPTRREDDVFPKFYRLSPDKWLNATYTHNPDPSYYGGRAWLFHLFRFYQRMTPRSLGTVISIFARRLS